MYRVARIACIALITLAVLVIAGYMASSRQGIVLPDDPAIPANIIADGNSSSDDSLTVDSSTDTALADSTPTESFPAGKTSPFRISQDDLRKLARLGDKLTFKDFKNFSGMDASSNLNYHIMVYSVDGGYRLIVRTDGDRIDSADLERIWDRSGSGIDIRYKDVDEFIKSHPSLPSTSCERVTQADVDSNEGNEHIYIDKSKADEGMVTLLVLDGSGRILWSQDLYTAHAGWDSLFLCELDDRQYLLRYNPYIGQGYASYSYSLFTLDNGSVYISRSNEIDFDILGVKEFNIPKMMAFANEINALLEKSILLLSTEGGKYYFGPSSAEQFLETYSWLEDCPELYSESDDLETRLKKYSDYIKNIKNY